VIFDGLSAPLINIQQYLFADLGESKILITTRNQDLASYIKATHVLSINPLEGLSGQELLSLHLASGSDSATVSQTAGEIEARRRIVDELGGLPLAISIVGAALRQGSSSRSPNISSQAYLGWSDNVKDILLDQDPQFSNYSSSVWKAFHFAFQGILQGHGVNRDAAALAHFAASCESASNLAEFIRLYRKARTNQAMKVEHSKAAAHSVFDQLRFLEIPILDLAISALAGVGMITVNGTRDQPADAPYVEMHSLVRKWLVNTDHQKVSNFVGLKLWLCGFAMLDELSTSPFRTSTLKHLFSGVVKELQKNTKILEKSQMPASEVALPLVLDAHIALSESVALLPIRPAQRRLLSQLSEELESEIQDSFEENLINLDWSLVFSNWARQLGEEVEYAVRSDSTQEASFSLKDFFLHTLDSHGCIPISFNYDAPPELGLVGHTATIESIKSKIESRIVSDLKRHFIRGEAFK